MIDTLRAIAKTLDWGFSHGRPEEWQMDAKNLVKGKVYFFVRPVPGEKVIDRATGTTTGEFIWNLYFELLLSSDAKKVYDGQGANDPENGKWKSYIQPMIKDDNGDGTGDGYLNQLLEQFSANDIALDGNVKFKNEVNKSPFQMDGIRCEARVKTMCL